MNFTFKYRLYPSTAQTEFLDEQLREAASLYNAALEERIGAQAQIARMASGGATEASVPLQGSPGI
jgi:transposase